MFTGSEEPSNQLVILSTFPGLCFVCGCSVSSSSIENSAASLGVAGCLGEGDLEELKNGRNVEERVGDCDGVLEYSGGISIVVLDRLCPREEAGGGSRGILLSSRLNLVVHAGEGDSSILC